MMDEMRRIRFDVEVDYLDGYVLRVMAQVAELLSNFGTVSKRIDAGADKRNKCPTCKGSGKL